MRIAPEAYGCLIKEERSELYKRILKGHTYWKLVRRFREHLPEADFKAADEVMDKLRSDKEG